MVKQLRSSAKRTKNEVQTTLQFRKNACRFQVVAPRIESAHPSALLEGHWFCCFVEVALGFRLYLKVLILLLFSTQKSQMCVQLETE